MQFAELSTVKHRLQLGAPLAFNVRNADRTLLLARGQVLSSAEQLQTLFRNGALVDLAELQTAREEILKAPRAMLPGLWTRCMNHVAHTLSQAHERAGFGAALAQASLPVQALIERDPDLAVFQVVCQGNSEEVGYGAQRSLQTAITAALVAQRLGWEPTQIERLFKVALTMNLSMLELQGKLARQLGVPTADQRNELQTHPLRSMRMLEQAGVEDCEWLDAVARHHEQEDGSGYPTGRTDVGDLASLARRSDVYTSKLSARRTRAALAADMAGRQMFMQDPGHPMTAALVKEFGIFPPGSYVRLASGELAVVVQRGPTITAPIVACLTSPAGRVLPVPQRMDTGTRAHAIAAVVGQPGSDKLLPMDRLAALVIG